MRLGLVRVVRAMVGVAVTLAVGAAGAGLVGAGSGAAASAIGSAPSWTVTVGTASRPLYPGTEATMPYSVRNTTAGTERLHATTTEVKVGKGGAGCDARWFRVASNSLPSDVDVPPGGAVDGSLVLAFDDVPAAQDGCQNIGLEVVVNVR